MSNELITLENLSPPEVFKTDKVTEILNYVEQRIKEFVPDETTPAGLTAIDEFAWKITKSKTLLVNMGDDYAKFLKAEPKRVDAERKRVKDTLEGWAKQVRKPVTDREEAEKARKEGHEAALIQINSYSVFVSPPHTKYIEEYITNLKAFCAGREWQEFHNRAIAEYSRVNNILEQMLIDQKKKDADHAELERLRREEEERNREKREAEIAAKATKDAEERAIAEAAKIAAETAKSIENERARAMEIERSLAESERRRVADLKAAEEKAEREKQAALQEQARIAAATQKKIDDEAAAKITADAKRLADQEHVAKINHAIVLGIVDIDRPELTTELAQVILTAIAEGKIPHVKIIY